MTGHDLDLEACKRIPHPVAKVLVAEVESLRAKLAAAEQERDTAKVNAVAALRLLEVNRAALAAVREAVEPLSGFTLDEFARSYARRDEDAAIVVQALYDLHQVLAAAEQDESDADIYETAAHRLANDDGRRFTLDEISREFEHEPKREQL